MKNYYFLMGIKKYFVGLLILCLITGVVGCASQYKKEFVLERPVTYEQGFKVAMKTVYDLNMSTYATDKDSGIISASTSKNRALEIVGGSYVQLIEIYLERNKNDEVNHIIITGGAAGGMIPHSQSGAENLCQLYFEKFKENLKKTEDAGNQQQIK